MSELKFWLICGVILVVFLLIVALFRGHSNDEYRAKCEAIGGKTEVYSKMVGKVKETTDFCLTPDGRILDIRD